MILDDVIAALVAKFSTAVDVPVHDGPVPTSVNSGEFVLVGSTGDDEDGAAVDLGLSSMGPGTWTDEAGEIVCSTWSWGGGTDLAVRRSAALGLAVACADALAADRTLGGLLQAPGLGEVRTFRYEPRQTKEGAICRIVFSVDYIHVNT